MLEVAVEPSRTDLNGARLEAEPPASAPSFRRPLRRLEWLLDESESSRTPAARRMRIALAILFGLYGIVGEATAMVHGDVQLTAFFFLAGAAAIISGRLGRLGRYFLPVFLGFFAYASAAGYVTEFRLGVHYKPQIWLEQHLLPGPLPTVWLQQHLYHGRTGVLEAFSVLMYLGHFTVPIALGVAFALTGRGRAFKSLMFTILTVSILAVITFVLAPTAPPWLAAKDGHLSGVHEILKTSLADLHMSSFAAIEGDPSKYDITAALPSLHTAFPVICLVTAVRAGLPRWAIGALAFDVLGVVFSIVYTGEHYLVDALGGALYALVAVLLVRMLSGSELLTRRVQPGPEAAVVPGAAPS